MINRKATSSAESASRMLDWGRILLVIGGVLLILAFGIRLAGSPRISLEAPVRLLWCGGGAAVVGAFLAALGAVEQRLIETRAALQMAIEQLRPEAPAQVNFRSRPTGGPLRGISERRR